jgi:uncharacterized protein YyaL (SSP411 family)
MTDAGGGWYSSLDADSEHEEGKFYVWSLAEIEQVLGGDAPDAIACWNVTAGGNFEGANILHLRSDDPAGEPAAAAEWKRRLYEVRARRVWPARDEKVLASWNGLMLRAMAEGARVFADATYAAAAVRNGEFLWREMVRGRACSARTQREPRAFRGSSRITPPWRSASSRSTS